MSIECVKLVVSVLHTLLRAGEDVGAGAHGPSDEHRLADELVVHGYEGVVRGDCPCAALAVHQQGLHLALHHVLLHLLVR